MISNRALRKARESIKRIAAENNISDAEVRESILEAMKAGMADPDPEVQAKWKTIPWKNGEPTPEEFIAWNVEQIRKRQRSD